MPSAKRSKVYIIAGPNGAGKTTFAKEFLPLYTKYPHFVNADLIAAGLEPFAPQTAALKAGRLVLQQLHEFAGQKKDFAFESTLSGMGYVRFLQQLKKKGYEITIYFLWIPSPSLAVARIKQRVSQGGHFVPSKDVRRRYKKSIQNFFLHYKPLADYWRVMDNTDRLSKIVAMGDTKTIDVFNQSVFEYFVK